MSQATLVTRRAVLTAGALLVAAGCGRATGLASGGKLFWATGGISPADQGPAEDIAKRWNDLHPTGPKVQVDTLPQAADDQREVLALELDAGLRNFDIFDLDVAWTAEFAQRGWLANLQQLRPDIERVSLPGPLRTAVWNGTLWAAPYVTDAGILYYRTDLVASPPATWQELLDLGRPIAQQNSIAPFVADGAQYEGLVVQYLEYFWGLGGEVLDREDGSVLFPLDLALQAEEFMDKAFHQGDFAPGFNTMKQEDARKTFQAGEAVFLRSYPYAYPLMNGTDPDSLISGKVGIAALPAFDRSRPVTALGGHNLAVNASSANIPAATEFVRFASTSREVQVALAQRHSRPPTLRVAYDDLARDPMMALLARVLPTARLRPAIPEWATISAEMQQQIFAAYNGLRDPRTAMGTLRDFLVATIKDG